MKQAFVKIHANKEDGDPRLSALKVDVDDRKRECIKDSQRGRWCLLFPLPRTCHWSNYGTAACKKCRPYQRLKCGHTES